MKDLASQGCRSIILASGTLAPLESFAKELGLPFPHRVENTHVIKDSQIYIAAVCRGPSDHLLNSSYKNRGSAGYVSDLGASIIGIARVTPGGILVFFTSYALLEHYITEWKRVVLFSV